MSTNFSCIVGSCVRKWFFSPVKRMYDKRRRFKDLRSISYSRLVKILADGAVATLPGNYMSMQFSTEMEKLTQQFRECSFVRVK
jgi:hypothetical protein